MSLYYYKAERLLKAGDEILPGSWGRTILGKGPTHHRYYFEYLLEKIRQLEFPEKPTRMEALFAFENKDYALKWNRGFAEHLYAVEPVDKESFIHRGDIEWIDSMSTCNTFECVETCARNYWRGKAGSSGGSFEIVIAGRLLVRERISRIADDDVLGETENR